MKKPPQPAGNLPLYLEVLPLRTPAEAGGLSRAANRRRGFGIAVTLDDSMKPKYRVFKEPDWQELVTLTESRPLIVGYNCRAFDLEILRGQGRVRPRKICDLMEAYEENRGRRVNINTAMERTIGFSRPVSAQDEFEWLRNGEEKRVVYWLKRRLSAMRQLHEFMIANGWKL